MVGETLDLRGEPIPVQCLDGMDNLGVQFTTSVLEQALVDHLMRKRVLERVLEVRK